MSIVHAIVHVDNCVDILDNSTGIPGPSIGQTKQACPNHVFVDGENSVETRMRNLCTTSTWVPGRLTVRKWFDDLFFWRGVGTATSNGIVCDVYDDEDNNDDDQPGPDATQICEHSDV
jgi:hypothetical protein